MLKSGDKVKIINNTSDHCYRNGEIVYFIGISVDTDLDIEIIFVFTNGKTEQGLHRKDFELIE